MAKTVPFLHSPATTKSHMLWTAGALCPIFLASLCLKPQAIPTSVVCFLLTIFAQLWINRRFQVSYQDFSPIVTGIILCLLLPANTPVWVGAIVPFFAIFGAKLLFGGFGKNWLNPACAGICTLLCLSQIWGDPLSMAQGKFLWGYLEGSLVEVSSLLVLAGALVLIWKNLAPIQIWLPYLVGVWMISLVLHASFLAILAWGGTILGAFFLSCDPVTSPVNRRFWILYGWISGCFATIFSYFLPATGGLSLGILIANILGHLADYFSED